MRRVADCVILDSSASRSVPSLCGSGGTGRRASLRSLLPQGSGGSNPLFRTNKSSRFRVAAILSACVAAVLLNAPDISGCWCVHRLSGSAFLWTLDRPWILDPFSLSFGPVAGRFGIVAPQARRGEDESRGGSSSYRSRRPGDARAEHLPRAEPGDRAGRWVSVRRPVGPPRFPPAWRAGVALARV